MPRYWTLRLGDTISLIAFTLFILSALVMVTLWVKSMTVWLGWPGFVLGLLSAPAGALFPFLHWLVDGSLSPSYLLLWFLGVAGVIVSMSWLLLARDLFAPRPEPAGRVAWWTPQRRTY